MTALRHCLAMSLGVVALALVLMVLGVPGAVVLALAPVAICLSMVLLMAQEGDVAAGLRRYESSRDAEGTTGDATPGEYRSTTERTDR